VDFIVYNDAGPTAPRVDMTGTADAAAVTSVPEPATLALFGASPPSQGEGLDRIIFRQFWLGAGGLGQFLRLALPNASQRSVISHSDAFLARQRSSLARKLPRTLNLLVQNGLPPARHWAPPAVRPLAFACSATARDRRTLLRPGRRPIERRTAIAC
jgi:hypothetical protein